MMHTENAITILHLLNLSSRFLAIFLIKPATLQESSKSLEHLLHNFVLLIVFTYKSASAFKRSTSCYFVGGLSRISVFKKILVCPYLYTQSQRAIDIKTLTKQCRWHFESQLKNACKKLRSMILRGL